MSEIRTTLGGIVSVHDALQKLAAQKLDAKARYHVAKLVMKERQEYQHFIEERNRLIEELGEPRDPTPLERAQRGSAPVSEVLLTSPHWPEFERRMKALADVAITIDWGPVTPAMLESCSDITAADLIALGPFCVLDPAVP